MILTKAVDIWSTGIIMMELLNYGKHPFDDDGETNTKKILVEKILHPKWQFSNNFSRLSFKHLNAIFYGFFSLAKDFFLKLTNDDPQNRYTADQALLHPWITRKFHEAIPLTFNEKIRMINLQADLSNVT